MRTRTSGFALAAALAFVGGCASIDYAATGQQVRLWGSSEVPPVSTRAYGTGVVNIADDRSVTVTLSMIDMAPTAAHIHDGAPGANGPVIVPLNRISAQRPSNWRITMRLFIRYLANWSTRSSR